jgi:hypothetical protein
MNAPARPTFKAMKPHQPVAAPVDFDKLASQATTFAEKENIPRQVHPRPLTATTGQGANAAATKADIKTVERFTVEIPTYLYEDIKQRLAAKKQTKKSLVLNAFHAAGYYVAPEDLVEDGRRGK